MFLVIVVAGDGSNGSDTIKTTPIRIAEATATGISTFNGFMR
jgi:hypothetical protein